MSEQNTPEKDQKAPSVAYVHTTGFPDLLRRLNVSLAVTTYQAQRLLFFSPSGPEKLFMLMRVFERPTGLALSGGRMAMCTTNMIWEFQAPGSITDAEGKPQPYDIYFVPRVAHVTGNISAHELAYVDGTLQIVNTRFSCLCTVSDSYSFTPGWHPRFITELAPEDRCHLNGMAVDEGKIRYVSALGQSNEKEGWRPTKAEGGIIIDFASGEIIARGLSMPHSPRVHSGRLFVLNSGTGALQLVDPATGARSTVAEFPGFLRGLAIAGDIAFVGLCKAREKKSFGGLPVEGKHPELQCAIYALDLRSGAVAGFIQFTKGIEELFDIQILPGIQSPHVLGFEEETISGVFILP